MSSQTLILPPAVTLDCPPWCDKRLHMGQFADHQREIAAYHVPARQPVHGQATVEVSVVQDPGEPGRIVLFVSECEGSHGDDVECSFGDGEMVELTPGQAHMVSRALSRAVSLLTDDSGDILPSVLVRAA